MHLFLTLSSSERKSEEEMHTNLGWKNTLVVLGSINDRKSSEATKKDVNQLIINVFSFFLIFNHKIYILRRYLSFFLCEMSLSIYPWPCRIFLLRFRAIFVKRIIGAVQCCLGMLHFHLMCWRATRKSMHECLFPATDVWVTSGDGYEVEEI